MKTIKFTSMENLLLNLHKYKPKTRYKYKVGDVVMLKEEFTNPVWLKRFGRIKYRIIKRKKWKSGEFTYVVEKLWTKKRSLKEDCADEFENRTKLIRRLK